MKCRLGLLVAVITIFLGGCATAPQQSVSLSSASRGAEAGRVGVAMSKMPVVDTYFPGASCLLCLATASMANSALTAHAKTLSYEDLSQVKIDLAKALRQSGTAVTVIDEEIDVEALPDFDKKAPGIARKNFSSLRGKYNVDRLLIISVGQLGYVRTYQAYFPTGEPQAVLNGLGYMVDLKTNAYDWYKPVGVSKGADQAWDEPPKFPGLTNAYFQVLELAKDSFLEPFIPQKAATAPQAANSAVAGNNGAASVRR